MAVNRRPENLAQYQEQQVQKTDHWAAKMVSEQLDEISTLGLVDTGKLFRALRYKLRKEFGETSSIGFQFPRYGIMLEKGVGRGYPIERVKTNQGILKRHPAPWFSAPLDDGGLEELADELASLGGDTILGLVQFDNLKKNI